MNFTLSVPLNQSWAVSNVEYKVIPDHSLPPINYAALWANSRSGIIYRYGGGTAWQTVALKELVPNNHHLWKFIPDQNGGGLWSTATISNEDMFKELPLNMRSSSVFCSQEEAGFHIGGYTDASSDERWAGKSRPPADLRIYNAKNSTWSVELLTAIAPSYRFWAGNAGVCVSGLSNSSMIFSFGGDKDLSGSDIYGLSNFSNITFYDSSSRTWRWQIATGHIPEARDIFCAAGVLGSNGTYEM